jgi:Cd2+/Zn2+-exporting ATPase
MTESDSPRGGDGTDGDHAVAQFPVPEMDCPSCADKVESSVWGLEGVEGVDARPTTGTLTVTYDEDAADRAAIEERVTAAGYEVLTDTATLTLTTPEMDCPSCAGKVENALTGLAGVESVDTQPTTGRTVVTYDPERADDEALLAAVEAAGYEVTGLSGEAEGESTDAATPKSVWTSTRALKTWASGAFLFVGILLEFLLHSLNPAVAQVLGNDLLAADALFLAGIAVGGQAIVRNGYYSLKQVNLDIDLLMTIAIFGAIAASLAFGERLYFEAATLAFLFSVSELLERYSMDRARDSLEELMELSPDEATVLREGGEEETVPVEDVRVGDVVAVHPGEKIPMDGVVVDGESAVNQAPITGESVPVDKTEGDEVYAGTINEAGYLEVEVTAKATENTLSRIVEMVEDAQANRTEREQFVDRFASYYTPIVVAIGIVLGVVPPLLLGGEWATWVLRGLTLFVLACPCAFVISTPVSVVSGVTSAAKNGVLVKGGNHLEAMGAVEAVAFDKTGTLTKGELTVTDVVPLGDNTETDVLRSARGLEARSEHPIGDAIVEHADDEGVEADPIEDFDSITGKGVTAELAGETHYAGKPGLFEELGFDLSHVHATTDGGRKSRGDFRAHQTASRSEDGVVTQQSRDRCERNDCLDLLEDLVPRLQSEGKTVVLVGTEDELAGVIAVADEVRPEAKAAVQRLRDLGVERTVMLTGDNERTARAIADQVDVDEFRAELLPDEKVAAVEELTDEFEAVAMVGDGVNDAPALATATVGVAMGAAGTDTALETADIALMGDDLTRLPYLYDLSHRANGVIRQNVWASLGAKAALAAGVPLGLVPIWAAVLVGDAGMTTAVTGNAMRLSRVNPELGTGDSTGDPQTAATPADD